MLLGDFIKNFGHLPRHTKIVDFHDHEPVLPRIQYMVKDSLCDFEIEEKDLINYEEDDVYFVITM